MNDILLSLFCFAHLFSQVNCVPVLHYELKEDAADQCKGKPDGKYAIKDVFRYLNCKDEKSKFTFCPADFIFDPNKKTCEDATSYTPMTFCEGRSDGDWRNPWNCHGFISCSNGRSHNMACAEKDTLVFNPYIDKCVEEKYFPCRFVNDTNPCKGKLDGRYSLPDVFRFMTCTEQHASYTDCGTDMIYRPKVKDCRPAKETTMENFCIFRNNLDWRNPWDCHRFIACSNGWSYNMPCALASLVFNPYHDKCVTAVEFQCKQVKMVPHYNIIEAVDDPCKGKPDGKYAIKDVFRYLVCKNGKSVFKVCPADFIFDPNKKTCEDAKSYSLKTFCDGRSDGDWRNPWNCHGFIACSNGHAYDMTCAEKDTLVFNPYIDACVEEESFACRYVNGSRPCKGKPDGRYSLPDVFRFMTCTEQQASYTNCSADMIYRPKVKDCRPAKETTIDNFCTFRNNLDWRNPWNCHRFIACSNGRAYNMPCAVASLVFDPYHDKCVTAAEFQCKQIKKAVRDAKYPCSILPDGNYPIRDVFRYMTCIWGVAIMHTCAKNSIFDARSRECLSTVSMDTFCLGRADGRWRNPWDCHQLLKCRRNFTYGLPCPGVTTVYNPYLDKCTAEYKCVQLKNDDSIQIIITDVCKGKVDGFYPIPDVFMYRICKSGTSSYDSCSEGSIFVPYHSKCVDASEITIENFGIGRPNGNWRNPWNCHRYLACNQEHTWNMPCQDPTFVYDPDHDMCITTYQCKQLKFASIPDNNNPCSKRHDGNYPIRDVFRYMRCKGGVAHLQTCPENSIFDTRSRECIQASKVTLETFCLARADGKWRDPWACHRYLACRNETTYGLPCPGVTTVYNPYRNKCTSKYKCVQLENDGNIQIIEDDGCKGKDDGIYPIPDVFMYRICESEKATYVSCTEGSIFVPYFSQCISASQITIDNFGTGRPNGNWRNPWDCHRYLVCNQERTWNMPCQDPAFVYDPYHDMCVTTSQCKQLGSAVSQSATGTSSISNKNPCKGLPDGMYPIPDVFRYRLCKSGKATYKDCPKEFIFVTAQSVCLSGHDRSVSEFCLDRPNGNWRNPWNCHRYLACNQEHTWNMPCQDPTFVYDPNHDRCVTTYPCKQIHSLCMLPPEHGPCYGHIRRFFYNHTSKTCEIFYYGGCLGNANNFETKKECLARCGSEDRKAQQKMQDRGASCSYLEDGTYPIPDVYRYITCKDHQTTTHSCPEQEIFDVGTLTCVQAESILKENFCKGRADGNYRDPWNCHDMFMCSGQRLNVMNCADPSLVFDPYKNECVWPYEFACNTSIKGNPCHHKEDGNYAISDVLRFLSCDFRVGTYKDCQSGMIFDEESRRCIPHETFARQNICKGRSDGVWRDPWDCESQIICNSGSMVKKRCPNELVFDPYNGKCGSSSQYACGNVAGDEICMGRFDGKYPMRNVFSYVTCYQGGKSRTTSCELNSMYDIKTERCLPMRNFQLKTFCLGRDVGNWRDPWHCHSFIACTNTTEASNYHEMACAAHGTLIYRAKETGDKSGNCVHKCGQEMPGQECMECRDYKNDTLDNKETQGMKNIVDGIDYQLT